MRFFIDEAGDFRVPAKHTTHRVAVAVGLAVTDHAWPDLATRYGDFVARLAPGERDRGEPKGRLLSPGHQQEFAGLLAATDGVCVAPVTLDLSSMSGAEASLQAVHLRVGALAEQMVHPSAREQMRLLERQVRNLSKEQVLRLYTWSFCIHQVLEHAILFLSHGAHEPSWNEVTWEIDRVQMRPGSREEKVASVMLYAWVTGWTRAHPLGLVEGIHTREHAFVKNFDTADGVDVGKLVRDAMHWGTSRESVGLQMADIAASIVHRAADQLDDRDGAVTRYATLMRSSPYGPARGPGLFSSIPDRSGAFGAKYKLLSDSMGR